MTGPAAIPGYAELQVTTNFSFLRGASHPHELVETAATLGHRALAVTDRNSFAGLVRAHVAAKAAGLPLVVGCRIDLDDAPSVLCYPTDRDSYGRLSQLLTVGRLRAPKGECRLARADLYAHAQGLMALLVPPDEAGTEGGGEADAGLGAVLGEARDVFGDRLHLAASMGYRGDDRRRLAVLERLAHGVRVPLVATNDVHYHAPDRRALQDVLTCIRLGTTIDRAGRALHAHAERHLKPPAEMARLFAHHPAALARTVEIAEACRFDLSTLRYEYPDEIATPGESPQATLERLTREGAQRRYPAGVPDRVREAVARELRLIAELDYAPYFLTVHDIVRFAEEQGILCQGRGSAANSVVCYCLGVTAVDPIEIDLLFERFVSAARGEPPDIDVDFEHERREEVIQHIYRKYGRDRAGLAATVIRYRTRGAIRDVGKAMGLSADGVERLARAAHGWWHRRLDAACLAEQGLDPADPRLARTVMLANTLIGFPRHLSQHVGGFVITRGKLTSLCPVVNARMVDRTTIEWDKDDIEALRILKVDVLALGMLSCIRRAFALIAEHKGTPLTLATVPREEKGVYDMLSRADSIGVFQVESRAQMSMLPRLKPAKFYDLVIEVAIVRPGPIQGDMVHPYLRRRNGQEPEIYPSEELRGVLEKTKGVPLFQEQAMRIAIVAAGFTADEADALRRSMATFRNDGTVSTFRDRFVGGMVRRGYEREFAERCFRQIEGFGTYGFPESHAASFAKLVYVSAWIKWAHPEVFAAALLNSQPMGFYAPAQIVRDAGNHGVTVRPPDINASDWDCTLEPMGRGGFALRLGLRLVRGLSQEDGEALAAVRQAGVYRAPEEIARRTGLGPAALTRLAEADAFGSIGLGRRAALWTVRRLGARPLPLFDGLPPPDEPAAALPVMQPGEQVIADYASLTLSLKAHPLALLRPDLAAAGVVPAASLATTRPGRRVSLAGLVLVRQRPGSAKDVVFMTLEDETGIANLILWPAVFERLTKAVLPARLLMARGRVQSQDGVVHLVVEQAEDWTRRLAALDAGTGVVLDAGAAARAIPDGRNFH